MTAKVRSIATAAKPDPNLAAVPIVFAVAMCLSLLIQAIAAATVAGCSAIVFAAGRWIASRVRAPLLEADSGRLRCPAAAQISEPALSTSKRTDLVIPWAECEHVVAERRLFDDGPADALVITTPGRTIAVRSDIFAELPGQIIAGIAAARVELAPPVR